MPRLRTRHPQLDSASGWGRTRRHSIHDTCTRARNTCTRTRTTGTAAQRSNARLSHCITVPSRPSRRPPRAVVAVAEGWWVGLHVVRHRLLRHRRLGCRHGCSFTLRALWGRVGYVASVWRMHLLVVRSFPACLAARAAHLYLSSINFDAWRKRDFMRGCCYCCTVLRMRWRTLLLVSRVEYLCMLTPPPRQRPSRRWWPCCHLLHGVGPLCWRWPRQAVMLCCMRRAIVLLRFRCHKGSCGC